jgi:hypothetical protein
MMDMNMLYVLRVQHGCKAGAERRMQQRFHAAYGGLPFRKDVVKNAGQYAPIDQA